MKPWLWWCVDGLLALAITLFLLPLDPRISSLPLLLWLAIQLLLAPQPQRWALWPLLALMLLSTRIWWFNDPPHPASFFDALLFVVSLLAATTVAPQRWTAVLRLPLLALIPLVPFIGERPWTPNPLAGLNQGAYVLGVLLLLAFAWLRSATGFRPSRWVAAAAVAAATIVLWQTGSRASLLSAGAALVLTALWQARQTSFFWLKVACAAVLAAVAYPLKLLFFAPPPAPTSAGAHASESARFVVFQCYSQIPFSGSNRLLYGVGFDRVAEFCSQPIDGLSVPLLHAHNLYLQVFAATGLLGLVGCVLIGLLLLQAWGSSITQIPLELQWISFSVLLYTLFQGLFDLSLLHWPIAVGFTGLLLGVPLAFMPASAQGADRR